MKASIFVNSEADKFAKPQTTGNEYYVPNDEASISHLTANSSKEDALRSAIDEGLSSGVAEDFDPSKFLDELNKSYQHA